MPGLLRGTFPHTNTGPKANKMPYVFTNPPRDTELFTCDKVFVLSPDVIYISFPYLYIVLSFSCEYTLDCAQPIRLKVHKKDDLREMHDYEARRKANLKIADDTIQIVRQLREDIKTMTEQQQANEEKATPLNIVSIVVETSTLNCFPSVYRHKIWRPSLIGSSKQL